MKNLIEDFINQNVDILEFSKTLDVEDADNAILLLADKLKETKSNELLGLDLAMLLQLSNDESIIKEFELADIQKLLTCLIKIKEFDIDNYVEAAHFEWVAMDDSLKAKEIAELGIKKAKEKIYELEKLLVEIKSE